MKNFSDKEYHPVIEDFIADYCDDAMGVVERDAFEEVLVHDDDLRELAHSAKVGKALLMQLATYKARDGFQQRLSTRIMDQN